MKTSTTFGYGMIVFNLQLLVNPNRSFDDSFLFC